MCSTASRSFYRYYCRILNASTHQKTTVLTPIYSSHPHRPIIASVPMRIVLSLRSSFNPLLIEAAASRTAIPRYRETRPYCEVIVSAPSCFVYHPLTVRCSYRCWLLLTVVEKITPSRSNQIQIIIKNILAIKALRSERTFLNVRG